MITEHIFLCCFAALALFGGRFCDAAVVTTSIEGKLANADGSPFNTTTRISLNNDAYSTYSRIDGSFVIYGVPPGVHQLDVNSPTHHFGQVKIQLLEDAMDAPKCLEYAYPGAMKMTIKYPLVLHPHAVFEFFEKRQGFSIFAMLKNPMVLMMLFSVGLMVVMPKMMEGLDPEEKARMRQQMEAQKDPTQMLSQMWGDITGGAEEKPAIKSKGGRSKKE